MHETVSHPPPPSRLPAGPLLEALEARAPWGSRARQLGPAGRRTYWRARTEGTLTIKAAVQLAAALGLDPAELYGPSWPAPAPAGVPVEDRARWRRLDAGPALEALRRYCRRRGISQREALGGDRSRLYRAVERARAAGTITMQAGEGLCDLIEAHPRELWQDDYDAAVLAGLPADYDPWEGVA